MHADALSRSPRTLTDAFAQRGARESLRATALNRMLSRKYDEHAHQEWLTTLGLADRYRQAAEVCRTRGERVYTLRESLRVYLKELRHRDDLTSWRLRIRIRLALDGANYLYGPIGRLP